jgi:NAD(P)-dependent dehydrogenase (short-subunit alcohol dehydrogenase family)
MGLAGRVVVTGGTGALGRAVVQALLRAGARVAVPYRGAAGWERLRAAAGGDSEWLFGRSCDLADIRATAAFMDEAAERMGGIDGLAAIAGGYAGSGPFEAAPEAEWDEMLRVNLVSTAHACRTALPHLLRTGGAAVLVGSRAVQAGGAGAAAYVVAKAGVHALTRALALENLERGVRVNAVVPGIIDTPANRAAMPGADAARWPGPESIAPVVLFLLSSASAPVTGAFVPVHGRS